jgi:adenylosuccinate synthase
MCTHYRLGDEVLDELPTDPVDIEQATPIMEYFAGWTEDLRVTTGGWTVLGRAMRIWSTWARRRLRVVWRFWRTA